MAWDWSHDGRYLLCNRAEGAGQVSRSTFVLLDLESHEETKLLSHPGAKMWQGQFSPDDRWIAFMSSEPRSAIYIAPFRIAPFRGKDPVTPDEWILIGSEELPLFLDKP